MQHLILHIGQGSTKISKINKNLYDKTNVIQIGLWGNNNSNLINTNYAGWYVIVKIIGGKTYTISRKNGEEENSYLQLAGTSTADFPANGVEMLNKWTQDLQNNGKKLQIQTAENANYLFIGLAAGQISEITEEIQSLAVEELMVEIGDTATNYVEHQETDYLLYIQQEMLQGDYFVKEADGWKEVHNYSKEIFDGTEQFTVSSSKNTRMVLPIANAKQNPDEILAVSNSFLGVTYNQVQENKLINAICVNNGYLSIDTDGITNVSEFKQTLADKYNAGNPVYIYYKEATPTKLPCTPEQSAVLEELSNLDLFDGVNNIITAENIAKIKLYYIANAKKYIDKETSDIKEQLNTINELLSTTATSSLLLDNLQSDLESEVM